jgi:transcriptional regulator with XRE-family HTH domain
MTYDAKKIAARVRHARTRHGLTQAALAERADLAFETISRIESGREPPSLRTIVALADALDTTVDVLLGREPERAQAAERVSPEVRRVARAISTLEPRLVKHVTALVMALARREKRRS